MLNQSTILSKIKLHRLTTFNMRLIAMTRILLQRLLWYTWKYYEWWNTWSHCDRELYTKYVVLLLNSQSTLKKYRTQYDLHDPPTYRKFSSYNFQKGRVKITTKCALYFRQKNTICASPNSILVTLRLSDGISQSLSKDCLVTAGSRHSQSLQPMAVWPMN